MVSPLSHHSPIHRPSLTSIAACALFIAAFALYATMAAPGLDWGDAAEAQMAALTGGLSHPTGYPLFLMLGWLWTHTLAPLGIEPTRAMTLLSAAFGAGTVALLVPLVARLLARGRLGLSAAERTAVGVATACFFALSSTFWSQALLAEVYTLHTLLLVAFLLASLSGYTKASALLLGLFLGHHRTAILWLPGLAFWLWWERDGPINWRRAAQLALLVALPQLLYLYVPLRGAATEYLRQPLADGQPLVLYDGSIRAALDHVLGTRWASNVTLKEPLSARLADAALLARANILAIMGILLALLGMVVVIRTADGPRTLRWSDRVLVASGGLLTFAFSLFYAVGDVAVMFIPAWLAATLLMGGAMGLLLAASKQQGGRWMRAGLAALALLLIALQLHAAPASRAELTEPRDMATRLLDAAPPNAILVSNDRDEIVPLWYAQFAENQRRDVLVVAPLLSPDEGFRDVTALTTWALQWGRPVYLTKEMRNLDMRYRLLPAAGGLWQVEGAAAPPPPTTEATLMPGLSVVGWAATPPRPAPGETVLVEVAVRPDSPLTVNPAFSLLLFDGNGQAVARAERQQDAVVPATSWPVGESLRLPIPLDVPADLPPGVYEWRLSAYLPLVDGAFRLLGEPISLGRRVIGLAPLPASEADGDLPIATFGAVILLTEMPQRPPLVARAGEVITYSLRWAATAAPTQSYTLFVHLIAPDGSLATQADAAPFPPTDTWQAGDVWEEQRTLTLPDALPAGRYILRVGLYDASGQRLPVATGGDSVDVAEITVER